MPTLQTLFRPALSAIAVAGALMVAAPASAEILRKDEMLRGVTMSQAQCAAIPQTVWVNAYGRDFCVRYYMSTAGGEGRRPVVFLQGDQFGPLDIKSYNWKDTSGSADVDTADLVSFANSFSKMTKTTAIYLARIGVDGTSGDHRSRKTVLELKLIDAALDAIKRRHGFEGFHIVGQSGGSQILGGLIGLRQDIGCAVAGSGQFLTSNMNGDPSRTYFDSSKYIPDVVRRPSLRLLGRHRSGGQAGACHDAERLRREISQGRPSDSPVQCRSDRPEAPWRRAICPARHGRVRPRQARRGNRPRHPDAGEAQPRVQRAEGARSASQDPLELRD